MRSGKAAPTLRLAQFNFVSADTHQLSFNVKTHTKTCKKWSVIVSMTQMKSNSHRPVIPSGSCCRSQYQSWLTGSQPSVMDKTTNLPSSDIWMKKDKIRCSPLLPCWRTYRTKKIYIHANNKTFQGDLKTGRPFLPEMTVKSATGLCTYSCWTVPFGMFGKLCNQNVLRLLGADDVIVELLVDVGRGLGTWEMQVFILD